MRIIAMRTISSPGNISELGSIQFSYILMSDRCSYTLFKKEVFKMCLKYLLTVYHTLSSQFQRQIDISSNEQMCTFQS